MTAPSYTTDLADFDTAEATTNWAEASGHTSGGAASAETEYFIQNATCISQSTGNSTGTSAGLECDYGSAVTLATNDCFFVWQFFSSPKSIDTFDNGGLRVGVGSSSGNIDFWKVGGSDFGRNPYGGWQCVAVDPTFTADYTDGTAAGTYQVVVSLPNMTQKVSKGSPHGVDVIRYGRGEIKVEYGEAADYATFAGMATKNDSNTTGAYNVWGLFQEEGTGYLWKGLITLGSATNAVDMRDSNRNITVDDCPRTFAQFCQINFANASSNIEWTNVNFTALSATQLNRGTINVGTDNPTFTQTNCTHTNLGWCLFRSNSTLTNVTFRTCHQIAMWGSDAQNCTFDQPTVAANADGLAWNGSTDPDGLLDGCSFTMGANSHHAIGFDTSSATTIYLNDIVFSGYTNTVGSNAAPLNFARTSGTINVYASGCTGLTANGYKTAGATVNIIIDPVTVQVTTLDEDGDVLGSCEVFLVCDGGSTGLPEVDNTTKRPKRSVSLFEYATGTVTVTTVAAHNLAVGDKVWVESSDSLPAYRGVQTIETIVNNWKFTYETAEADPKTTPGGELAYVFLYGTSNATTGILSMSRTFTEAEAVIGWARKSSASPYYKQGPLSGTVSITAGLTLTARLTPDE